MKAETPRSEIENKRAYAKLLADVSPHVIHTEGENERYMAALEMLLAKRDRTPEESRLVGLLTLLVEDLKKRPIPYGLPRRAILFAI